jgi:endonuclease III
LPQRESKGLSWLPYRAFIRSGDLSNTAPASISRSLRTWRMPRSSTKPRLQRVVSELAEFHGPRAAPAAKNAFELILWEKVAYLADDETRSRAFAALKRQVGTGPAAVATAKLSTLREIAAIGGAVGVAERARRMQEAAQLVIGEFDGDLDLVISKSSAAGRKALRRFYGVGEPGADKILLFTRSHAVLPLDSNGARVLVRVGYGTDHKNYSTMYRSVVDAARPEVAPTFDWLIDAHLLLRHHGQTICKTNTPRCEACVLRGDCAFAARAPKRT